MIAKDERWAVGDPAFGAIVGWHAENLHYLVSASANVPVGDAGDHQRREHRDDGREGLGRNAAHAAL